jgi:outer membrane protein OmpA-like peptidoglycan-associated protein
VLFDFDQDILSDTAQQQLDDIYALLRKNRSMNMEISGHTDSIGNQTYNDTLSFRRATRVINYLVNKGIERSRFEIKYFGAEKPVAPNETDQGRAMNRRVEFQIIRMKYELIKQDQK